MSASLVRPPMRVMSLSDNVSWLTALANDEGYEHIFSRQLENFAQPGGVLKKNGRLCAPGRIQTLLENASATSGETGERRPIG
jgi:hypothetical protein